MRYLLKPIQWIYCLYALLLFVAIMLLIFPFALIASFFGKIRGGNMIYRLCMFWGDIWFPLVFIFHKNLYEQPHDRSRQYIFVINHISYLDAAIIVKTVRQPVRPLGRIELSKMPVFGFIYRNAIITVDRSDSKNRLSSVRRLKAVLRRGISIVFFPEGTFNLTHKPLKEFFDGAFRIAIETQTPIRPILFIDSYKRHNYKHFFSLTPGRCRTVYLEEVSVAGLTIHDVPVLKQKVYDLMERKLIQYGAPWIKL